MEDLLAGSAPSRADIVLEEAQLELFQHFLKSQAAREMARCPETEVIEDEQTRKVVERAPANIIMPLSRAQV